MLACAQHGSLRAIPSDPAATVMEEPEEGDAVQPDGPMAEELAAEVLVSIIDALGLEEVGDPYLTLRAGAHRIL